MQFKHVDDNFVLVKGAIALYPRINKPYRYDEKKERTVACDALDNNAQYEMKIIIDEPTAKKLHKLAKQQYAENKKPKWPERCPPSFEVEETDDGEERIVCTLRKKAAYDGDKTVPPEVVDAARKNLSDNPNFMLTSGSTVNVAFSLIPYSMPTAHGVSLRLHSVQVIDLVPAKAHNPFDEEDGYTADEDGDTSHFDSGDDDDDEPVVKKKKKPVVDDDDDDDDDDDEPVVKKKKKPVVDDDDDGDDDDDEPTKVKSKKSKSQGKAAKKGDMSSIIDEWDDDDD